MHPIRAWQGIVREAVLRAFGPLIRDAVAVGVADHNEYDMGDELDLLEVRAETDRIMSEVAKAFREGEA